jgi:hypothetical protein
MHQITRTVRRTAVGVLAVAALGACPVALLPASAAQRAPQQQAAPSAAVDLRARFDRQQPTVYEVELRTEQRLDLGEVTQEYTATYASRVAITLLSSTSALTTVRLVHERVAVSFEGRGGGPGVPMGAYDSDNPDAPGTTEEYRAIIAPMIGKPLTIELTPEGEFVGVRDLDSMAPEGVPGMLFRQMFTEQTFQDMYAWLFALKTHPSTAEVGETWMMVQSANNPLGTMRRMYDLTLNAVAGEGGHAAIDIAGSFEIQGSVPGMFEVKPSESGPMVRGKATWDPAKRQVVSLSCQSQTHVNSTTPGMVVRLKVNASTTLKRVDRPAPLRPAR